MDLTKIKALAAVLTVAFAASAQFNAPGNARTAGMGGAPTADISGVFSYPVLMMGYTDQLQATFPEGGIIGVKEVSETFAIGILANQGLMAGDRFSGAATAAMNGVQELGGFNDTYSIPHLLLGFDLGAMQLGADIFFDYARASYTSEVGSSETTASGLIINPGARVSLGMGLGDIDLLAKLGLSLPSYSGEYNPAGGASQTTESSNGVYLELGAEVGLPLMGLDWTAGMQYAFTSYKASNSNAAPSNRESIVEVYLGAEFNVLETAAASLGYNFTRNGLPTVYENSTDRETYHFHTFNGGIENIWTDTWFFDAVAMRCGAAYRVQVDIEGSETSGNADTYMRRKDAGFHNGVMAILGAGFSKEFFTLDVAIQPGSWGGLFTGPDVFLATGTIKF